MQSTLTASNQPQQPPFMFGGQMNGYYIPNMPGDYDPNAMRMLDSSPIIFANNDRPNQFDLYTSQQNFLA